MRYQVPQFIEFESKVIWMLSFRQFAYMLGAAGGTYFLYTSLGFTLGIVPIILLWWLASSLAFIKVHGRPFIDVIASAFYYLISSRLYIWHKKDKPLEAKAKDEHVIEQLNAPTLSQSKLKDLAWSLDVNEKILKDR